jgi:hypothetical protein
MGVELRPSFVRPIEYIMAWRSPTIATLHLVRLSCVAA